MLKFFNNIQKKGVNDSLPPQTNSLKLGLTTP